MTLAAARDDQFLVEQDLHEAAAPMGRLLQDRDHGVPRRAVAVSHPSRSLCQSQILMAVHSCLPGDPDMAGSEAQRAYLCRGLSRFGDFCLWEEIWQQPRIQTGAA